MLFDLIRPCTHCPFRADHPGYLTSARAEEIAYALLGGATFACHATVQYDENDDGEGEAVETNKSQHCAGALIFLELQEQPNQMMRWMERIGYYDRRKLDMGAPVFEDADEFIEHHGLVRSR